MLEADRAFDAGMGDELKGWTRRAIDAVGAGGMWAYKKSDVINRYVTIKAAKTVAKDLVAGKRAPLKMFKEMPQVLKGKFMQAVKDKNLEEVERLSEKWLLDRTQFIYSPETAFQAGRDYGVRCGYCNSGNTTQFQT